MRIVRYICEKESSLGLCTPDGKGVVNIAQVLNRNDSNLTELMQTAGENFFDELHTMRSQMKKYHSIPLDKVRILAPIQYPAHDILCVGVNYREHGKEAEVALAQEGLSSSKQPVLFSKRVHCIAGPYDNVYGRFDLDKEMDYEVELAVIIGKEGKDIRTDKALDHVFGYSVFNDFSSRHKQRVHKQWFSGKSMDGYAAMGPAIVTADEMHDLGDRRISCCVNGQLRQSAYLREMTHSVTDLIVAFSTGMTLVPGDIIATGTPSGVGMGMTPKQFLRPGDEVACEVEGIGMLTNYIEQPVV